MRTITLLLITMLAFAALVPARTPKTTGNVRVRPHTTKKGTYVPGHIRTRQNQTQRDNWSSKPNVNPRTGKAGTKTPRR